MARVCACDPSQMPKLERATRLLQQMLPELGVSRFLGAILADAKPRLILRFQVEPGGALSSLGLDIVLKVYGDRPRGEGPLLAHWRAHGVNVPRVLFGERDGCSWLALEYLSMSVLQPHGRTEVLSLTAEVASRAAVMHAPAPRLTALLRALDTAMIPRWEAS